MAGAVLWWIRPTNLRLLDNNVLIAACAAAAAGAPRPGAVYPLFVFDDALLQRSRTAHLPRASMGRLQFLIDAVADMRAQLQEKYGVQLIVRVGSPSEHVLQVIQL